MLEVERVALEAIGALRPLMPRIARHDRALDTQLRKAASSMVLNVCEAQHSDPGNRRARFHSAAGSANESRGALRVAVGWGYVTDAQARPVLELLDRVVAMLWKLTH
jgi:four helix bundle protein